MATEYEQELRDQLGWVPVEAPDPLGVTTDVAIPERYADRYGILETPARALAAGVGLAENLAGGALTYAGADEFGPAVAAHGEYVTEKYGNPALDSLEGVWDSPIAGTIHTVGKVIPLIAGVLAGSAIGGSLAGAAGLSTAVGTTAGAFGASYGIALGDLTNEAIQGGRLAQEVAGDPTIAALGIPYAALEMILPLAVKHLYKGASKSAFINKNQMINRGGATGVLGRTGKATALGFATEAPTELGQEELVMQMNPTLTEEQKSSRRLEAFVLGGIGGGGIAAPSGLRRNTYEPKDIMDKGPKAQQAIPLIGDLEGGQPIETLVDVQTDELVEYAVELEQQVMADQEEAMGALRQVRAELDTRAMPAIPEAGPVPASAILAMTEQQAPEFTGQMDLVGRNFQGQDTTGQLPFTMPPQTGTIPLPDEGAPQAIPTKVKEPKPVKAKAKPVGPTKKPTSLAGRKLTAKDLKKPRIKKPTKVAEPVVEAPPAVEEKPKRVPRLDKDRKLTAKQRTITEKGNTKRGGQTVYVDEDVALVETYTKSGQVAYLAVDSKGNRTQADIDEYKGKGFTEDQTARLKQAKQARVIEQEKLAKAHPDGPLKVKAKGVAGSKNISRNTVKFVAGLKKMLNLKEPMLVVEREDLFDMKLTGDWANLGAMAADVQLGGYVPIRNSEGVVTGHAIIIGKTEREQLRPAQYVETVAHEFGHALQTQLFEGADTKTQNALMGAFNKWMTKVNENHKEMTVKELIFELRGYASAQALEAGSSKEFLAKTLGEAATDTAAGAEAINYLTSFNEFFADQVAKWVGSAKKPQTLVDHFFKKAANYLRRMYASVLGKKHLPTAEFKQFLDRRAELAAKHTIRAELVEQAREEGRAQPKRLEPTEGMTLEAMAGLMHMVEGFHSPNIETPGGRLKNGVIEILEQIKQPRTRSNRLLAMKNKLRGISLPLSFLHDIVDVYKARLPALVAVAKTMNSKASFARRKIDAGHKVNTDWADLGEAEAANLGNAMQLASFANAWVQFDWTDDANKHLHAGAVGVDARDAKENEDRFREAQKVFRDLSPKAKELFEQVIGTGEVIRKHGDKVQRDGGMTKEIMREEFALRQQTHNEDMLLYLRTLDANKGLTPEQAKRILSEFTGMTGIKEGNTTSAPDEVAASATSFASYLNSKVVEFRKDNPTKTAEAKALYEVSKKAKDFAAETLALQKKQYSIEGAYFPMMRFGEHVVVARSATLKAAQEAATDAAVAYNTFKTGNDALTHYEGIIEERAAYWTARNKAKSKAAKNKAREEYKRVTQVAKEYRESAEYKKANEKAKELRNAEMSAHKNVRGLKKLSEHYLVEKYEKEYEALQRVDQLATLKFDDGTTVFEPIVDKKDENASAGVYTMRSDEWFHSATTVNQDFMQRVEGQLSASLSGLSDKVKQRSLEAVRKAYKQTAQEDSAMARFLQRQYVPGYNKDAERVFNSFIQQSAHRLATIKYIDEMQRGIADMQHQASQKSQRAGEAGRTDMSKQVANEVVHRYANDLVFVDSPRVDAFVRMTHTWLLGASPAYLFMQAAQTPMIALPVFAARIKAQEGEKAFGTASKYLWTAFQDSAQIIKYAMTSGKSKVHYEIKLDETLVKDKDGNPRKLPPDEIAVLQQLFEQGALDILLESDVANKARGISESKYQWLVDRINWPARQLELNNRLTTGLAAYRYEKARLAKEAGPTGLTTKEQLTLQHDTAMLYAKKLIEETQVNYSNQDAPRWFKSNTFPFVKVIAQFRKYQVAMASLLIKNFGDAFLGNAPTPKAKKEAQYILGYMFLTHGAMTGAIGLPGIGVVIAALNMLGMLGDDDDEWDVKVWMAEAAEYVNEETGLPLGDIMTKGLPTMLGWDLSMRMGMGQIFSPVPFLKHAQEDRLLQETMFSMGGAGLSVAQNMVAGTLAMADGDYQKAFIKMTPKWLADFGKAYQLHTEGIVTKSGNVAVPETEFHIGDVVSQSMGMNTLKKAKYYERLIAFEENRQAVSEVRTRILRDMAEAKTPSERASAKADQDDFNENRTTYKARIKSQDVHRYKERRKREQKMRAQYRGLRVYKRDVELLPDF